MAFRYSLYAVLACLIGIGCGTDDGFNPWTNCSGKCDDGASTQSSLKTRYPIYFAHGFKSSADSAWGQLIRLLKEKDPSLMLFAGDVDPGGPLAERSQAFRRNIQQALAAMETQQSPPDGDKYWKINIIAHSMGGLDSRFLLNHTKYNNDRCHTLEPCQIDAEMCCYKQLTTSSLSYGSDHSAPEACCAAGPGDSAIWWRDRIASVTTLSTPHRGSAFAEWGVNFLNNEKGDDKTIPEHRVAMRMIQFFRAEHKDDAQVFLDASNTFKNLSQTFNNTPPMSDFSELDQHRIYSWYCALGSSLHCDGQKEQSGMFDNAAYPYAEESDKVAPPTDIDWPQLRDDRRDDPRCANLPQVANSYPRIETTGRTLVEREIQLSEELQRREICYKLPGPKKPKPHEHGMPPIFSWAGRTCPSGPNNGPPCGDYITPELIAMYDMMTEKEGYNDGIVSVRSARFGLFMGVIPADHMNWTTMEGPLAKVYRFVSNKKPVKFHYEWLRQLQQAGY